jgi:hypothetical protein
MLGDRAGAEDVVHDAFCGIYRRWAFLTDPGKAQQYLRSAVLNGSHTALRRDARRDSREPDPPAPTADAAVFSSEDRHALMAGLRRLPDRQREALVLRYRMRPSAPGFSPVVKGPCGMPVTAERAVDRSSITRPVPLFDVLPNGRRGRAVGRSGEAAAGITRTGTL